MENAVNSNCLFAKDMKVRKNTGWNLKDGNTYREKIKNFDSCRYLSQSAMDFLCIFKILSVLFTKSN